MKLGKDIRRIYLYIYILLFVLVKVFRLEFLLVIGGFLRVGGGEGVFDI